MLRRQQTESFCRHQPTVCGDVQLEPPAEVEYLAFGQCDINEIDLGAGVANNAALISDRQVQFAPARQQSPIGVFLQLRPSRKINIVSFDEKVPPALPLG